MSDALKWNAFVCGDCRAIMRLAGDYSQSRLICPTCGCVLRVPKAGEIEMIIESVQQINEAIAPVIAKGERRKKKQSLKNLDPSWENDGSRQRVFEKKSSLSVVWLTGLAVSGVILCIGIAWVLFGLVKNSLIQQPLSFSVIDEKILSPYDVVTPLASTSKIDEVAIIKRVARDFLNTTSREKIRPQVRSTASIDEKICRFHQTESFSTDKFLKICADDQIVVLGKSSYRSINVIMFDSTSRKMFFEKTADGYLVDWESWVGWSDLDIKKIMKQKPQNPFELRAIVELENYYNFDFPPQKESEWQSYLIKLPDQSILHGYVKKDSSLQGELLKEIQNGNFYFILELEYPQNSSNNNQLLINKLIKSSWFLEK
jgi:hypothetical protein